MKQYHSNTHKKVGDQRNASTATGGALTSSALGYDGLAARRTHNVHVATMVESMR